MSKKEFEWLEDESNSLLNTNSAKMAEEAASVSEKKPMDKKKAKSLIAAALTVLGIIIVFVVGAVASELNYRAEQTELANRAIRDGEETHYAEEPNAVDNELAVGITAVYYSKENGMNVTVTLVSGYDKEVNVESVTFVIKNKDGKRIASAGETAVKNWTVAAGATVSYDVYLKPNVVEITDDPLEEITYEITTEETMAA